MARQRTPSASRSYKKRLRVGDCMATDPLQKREALCLINFPFYSKPLFILSFYASAFSEMPDFLSWGSLTGTPRSVCPLVYMRGATVRTAILWVPSAGYRDKLSWQDTKGWAVIRYAVLSKPTFHCTSRWTHLWIFETVCTSIRKCLLHGTFFTFIFSMDLGLHLGERNAISLNFICTRGPVHGGSNITSNCLLRGTLYIKKLCQISWKMKMFVCCYIISLFINLLATWSVSNHQTSEETADSFWICTMYVFLTSVTLQPYQSPFRDEENVA